MKYACILSVLCLVLLLSGCRGDAVTKEAASVESAEITHAAEPTYVKHINWIDHLVYRGQTYLPGHYTEHQSAVTVAEEDIGEILVYTEHDIAHTVYSDDYQVPDNTAARYPKGTPLYKIKGVDDAEAVAVWDETDGVYYRYFLDPRDKE